MFIKNKELINNTINNNIKSKNIRLIDVNGEQLGIFELNEAIKKAKNLNLDLVELNSNNIISVCKIMNYSKFIYQKNKDIKKYKKKQKTIQIKEIKIRPNIDKQDFNIKLKNIIKFIKYGNKVKITINFKGREIIHKNIGIKILNDIKNDLKDISILEYISNKIEGKQIIMILLPKNNK